MLFEENLDKAISYRDIRFVACDGDNYTYDINNR